MEPAIREGMMRADAAIKQRNRPEASAALRQALSLMAASHTEAVPLRAMLPVQAAFQLYGDWR